jgi:carboxylesterase type B
MRVSSSLLLTCEVLLLCGAGASIVQTLSGPVQGRVEWAHGKAVEHFKGLPFAAPPVGANRWRAPQPVAAWSSVRVAEAFGDACVQSKNAMTELFPVAISEDCLYLNVYRPAGANASSSLPVMLFFHGGSYVLGAASFLPYEATERIGTAPEKVIIVTANYRLQALGYLGGELLRSELYPGSPEKTTGNWGFLDQREAMRWVHRNIARFGGDPRAVTIFGESAGAGSVSAHLVSEGSWPFFARVAAESGPTYSTWVAQSAENAEKSLASFKALVGCAGAANGTANDTLACLRNVPVATVLAAGRHGSGTPGGVGLINWCPTADGIALKGQPRDLLIAGRVNTSHQVLLGTNKDEGSAFVHPKGVAMTEAGYAGFMEGHFGTKLGAEIVARYPSADYSSPFWAAVDAFGDVAMTCPARETARLLSAAGVDVYLYFFVHELNVLRLLGKHDDLGVFHGSELFFVFDKSIGLVGPDEHTLAANFGRWWTTFAATGSPVAADAAGQAEWPRYSAKNDTLLRIDAGSASAPYRGLKQAACDWWLQGHYPSDNFSLPIGGLSPLAEVAGKLLLF